jgi:hypothetical protein
MTLARARIVAQGFGFGFALRSRAGRLDVMVGLVPAIPIGRARASATEMAGTVPAVDVDGTNSPAAN